MPTKRRAKRRSIPAALVDLVLICVGLLVFALFHHVLPSTIEMEDLEYVPRVSATSLPQVAPYEGGDGDEVPLDDQHETPIPTTAPAPTQIPYELMTWRQRFAEHFTDGEVKQTNTSYQSKDISVTVTHTRTDTESYFVADIYVSSIDALRVELAGSKFGKNVREAPETMAERANAIVAISGDYYSLRKTGPVVRNGMIYRKNAFRDVCALYYNGEMKTYSKKQFDLTQAVEDGVYQVWSFGPRLLNDGKAAATFDSDVPKANPRCAIGYYEPGHYCFVVIDGRTKNAAGMTLKQMAKLFEKLGCKEAYNLDGGQTAQMFFLNELVNSPTEGGRDVSDIIYIGELAEGGAAE